MGHTVTLGGDRLGAGKKNKQYLRNYERSTHDLSQTFTSSMGVGMLIPFLIEPVTRDDKFEIDLYAGLRTIPTKAPLFGSFKLQVDVFECPSRLYQALLHNNPLAIGLNASQVKFPKIILRKDLQNGEAETIKTANNSLLKYLGISGLGYANNNTGDSASYQREFDACPLLAYYDIFKNYYANKQEEKAYLIGHNISYTGEDYEVTLQATYDNTGALNTTRTEFEKSVMSVFNASPTEDSVTTVLKLNKKINKLNVDMFQGLIIGYRYSSYEQNFSGSLKDMLKEGKINGYDFDENTNKLSINYNTQISYSGETWDLNNINVSKEQSIYTEEISLNPFALKEIDDIRMDILSFHSLGESFQIDPSVAPNSTSGTDIMVAAIGDDNTKPNYQNPLAGICVKTYQNDLFNNWLRTEWIDGENGIAAITAISTASGKIEIDAINFSEKLYNLLNRVAISDGTYYGYLDAAYTDSAKNMKETPIWIGGMSDEIIFDEIVQTAPTDGQPLGTLGGRGNLMGRRKGGKITVKIDEPGYIIGIVSITPRINYNQGNAWYMTEIDSLADIHVPAMDGIGFQNLLAEQMHAGAVILKEDGTFEERQVVGKVPAWINYMTAVDKSFGDFASDGSGDYMVLNRDYNCQNGELLDATTYIDPAKFNYAFAYAKTDAQNFWVRIHSNIKARRLMSARQIPSV